MGRYFRSCGILCPTARFPRAPFCRVALVVLFPTKLYSLDSEFPRKSYSVLGFCCFSVTGSTGTRTGTTAGHFWCLVPVPLPHIFPGSGTLSSPEIWTGSTGPPEVPVTVAVLPLSTSGENFRRHFRLFSQVLDVLESPGFWTGSDTGTTAKPEVSALPAELPPPRVFLF